MTLGDINKIDLTDLSLQQVSSASVKCCCLNLSLMALQITDILANQSEVKISLLNKQITRQANAAFGTGCVEQVFNNKCQHYITISHVWELDNTF